MMGSKGPQSPHYIKVAYARSCYQQQYNEATALRLQNNYTLIDGVGVGVTIKTLQKRQ